MEKFAAVRAYIFDLDGTLIDSKIDIVNSVNAMLVDLGREQLPMDLVASYVGHGAPRLVASALGPEASQGMRHKVASCRRGESRAPKHARHFLGCPALPRH